MPFRVGEWERVVVAICGLAFVLGIVFIVNVFGRDIVVISALSIVVLSSSIFGELRDKWNSTQPFSLARVFFRTFECFRLAAAGYIILTVIGNGAGISA